MQLEFVNGFNNLKGGEVEILCLDGCIWAFGILQRIFHLNVMCHLMTDNEILINCLLTRIFIFKSIQKSFEFNR